MQVVTAVQGDSIHSLAALYGHFWETIWNDPANAGLRARRTSPAQLAPGDEVAIPDLRTREERGATGGRLRFRRKGVPAMFRLQLKTLGEPRANEAYVLELDGALIEGKTGPDGRIEVPISPRCRGGELRLRGGAEVIPIRIGHLDPLSETSGVMQRLANLGHTVGTSDDGSDEVTRSALAVFQLQHGLDVTGAIDPATRAKIAQLHA